MNDWCADWFCDCYLCLVPRDTGCCTSWSCYLILFSMLTWTFASHKEHSPSWYTVAIIVVLMLVVYGIVEQLYLMSVVSFLFAGVYLLMENNTTPTTEVHILENGIQVGASYYEYIECSLICTSVSKPKTRPIDWYSSHEWGRYIWTEELSHECNGGRL